MTNKKLLYITIIVTVVALSAVFLSRDTEQISKESAFNRVMSSGTIKVGYITYPPYITKDPETGELSGVFYDITNTVAQQLELEVEWVEEGGLGTIFTNLNSDRYDVYGGGLWANSTRAKAGYLTIPVFYDSVYAYARSDDDRFNDNLSAINNPAVRISTQDGELGDVIAKTDFPKAQRISLPQTSPFDQIALQVVTNKADVVLFTPVVFEDLIKANANSLKLVSKEPLRVFGNVYAVKQGESELQQMFNMALQEAIDSGAVDKIISKYRNSEETYLEVAPSYKQ